VGRIGQSGDVAAAVLYLCSDLAGLLQVLLYLSMMLLYLSIVVQPLFNPLVIVFFQNQTVNIGLSVEITGMMS
jgi:hypothetical protein